MNSGIDESKTKQGLKYQTIISTMSKETSSKRERKGRGRNLTSISYDGNENNRQRRGKIRKRKRKRKRRGRPPKDGAEVDEASRLQRRARNLMIKMKFEQNLIDAYSAEGWKGQSREKVRPQHELQRAMNQILKCKLGIRDAIHQLDLLSSEGCIEDSAIAPDGSVYHENIFCAKCKLREAFPDNDIILCDGTCNCAFHQKCLDPPLLTKDIPQGDEGWFCKLCECKMDILEAMNAHIGTHFSVASNWQEIFKEEAALTTDGRGNDEVLHMEEEWPSDESDDDDFDPEKFESQSRAQSDDNVSESASNLCLLDGDLLIDSSSSDDDVDDDTTDCEILSGRRQRRAVDYKKLYHEMFGKDAPVNEPMSEDEDWGPTSKRKRREKESDAASTLITLCEIENQWSNEENIINNDNDNNNNSNSNNNKSHSNNNAKEDEEDRRNSSKKTRRISFRLPTHAVEKLRCVFAENELPSKAVRDELSEQLGLDSEKVNKWFKNARYLALKARKQLEGQKSLLNISPRMSMEAAGFEVGKEKNPTDKMLSKDMVTFGVMEADKVQICNILKKQVDVQNNFELLTTPPDKRHPVETKAAGEFGDDVSLKLVKEKAKREKRVEFEVNNSVTIVQKSEAEAEAEAEMERLCKIESKVQRLQQLLLRLPNRSRDPTACVVYVPIAELKEKN